MILILILNFFFLGFMCRLKIFVPIAILSWAVLVPVNWTNSFLELHELASNGTSSDIDKLSISNVPDASNRFASRFLALLALMADEHF